MCRHRSTVMIISNPFVRNLENKEHHMLISLPMYAVVRDDVEQFWLAFSRQLASLSHDVFPTDLSWPEDRLTHWQHPDLLLSQTCGFPLVEFLPNVQLVGTFSYDAPGCTGPYYRSFLVVRDEDRLASLSDFRGRRAAFNSTDSQSGYNSLRALVAPLAEKGQFFGLAVESGGHRQSLELVRQGQADIAAIDCVTLELLRRYQPQELEGLCIIGETAATPGLPLIASASTPPETLSLLRLALLETVAHPPNEALCERLLIHHFSVLPREEYQVIQQMKEQARQRGVTGL